MNIICFGLSLIMAVLSLYCKSCATGPRGEAERVHVKVKSTTKNIINITNNIVQPFHLIITLAQFYSILHRTMDD